MITFGENGYATRYRIYGDGVTIQAVRHQKEADF